MPLSYLMQKIERGRRDIERLRLAQLAVNHAMILVLATMDEVEKELDRQDKQSSEGSQT